MLVHTWYDESTSENVFQITDFINHKLIFHDVCVKLSCLQVYSPQYHEAHGARFTYSSQV